MKPYYLQVGLQFILFFVLFITTNYLMSLDDHLSNVPFGQVLYLILYSAMAVSIGCVLLVNIWTLFSTHVFFKSIGFLFGLIQIYFNFIFYEYFIVFKTPLYGKDIVYIENTVAMEELFWGIFNIRFIFFIILPSIVLGVLIFSKKFNFSHTKKNIFRKVIVFIGIIILGAILGFVYFEKNNQTRKNRSHFAIGYRRNSLIVIYEAIANYFQFEIKIPPPNKDITKVRTILRDKEQRVFTSDKYPLLQEATKLFPHSKEDTSPIKKNIIIIMFESLPSAEIYALSQKSNYLGITPYFEKVIDDSIVFNNTIASGKHTFFGFTDILNGVPNYDRISWNKKIYQKFYFSLPFILKLNGYKDLVWFYGGDIFFDRQSVFAKNTGFNKIYSQSSFPDKAKRSNWGISDREIFLKAAQGIDDFNQPFLWFIQGVSKHHPWNTPPDFDQEGYEKEVLSKYPNIKDSVRNSYKLIYYNNQVLREFIERIKKSPKFRNTIVIITSDQSFFPDTVGENLYENLTLAYKIPLIFYNTGMPPKTSKLIASHLDIIPSLINLLKLQVPKEIPYTGKNLFNPIYKNIDNSSINSHLAFWDGNLLQFNDDRIYMKEMSLQKPIPINVIDSQGNIESIDKANINYSELISIKNLFNNFETIYQYIIFNNLVYDISKKY